jgi:hypothetical protein
LKKVFVTARNVVGTVGLVLAAYLFIKSVPDVGRYMQDKQNVVVGESSPGY